MLIGATSGKRGGKGPDGDETKNPLNNLCRGFLRLFDKIGVGLAGFEPTTSSTPCWRDTWLRYNPFRIANLGNSVIICNLQSCIFVADEFIKGVAIGVTDGNDLILNKDPATFDAGNFVQRHNIRSVYAYKTAGRKDFLHLLHIL